MSESWGKLSEWYGEFSWRRVDILDMLFLAWLLAAFIAVGLINIYLRFFGRLKPAGSELGAGTSSSAPGGGLTGAPGQGESVQWANSLLSWLYLHYEHTPEFIDCWLKALNEQARKQTGDVQIKFDRVQAGSLPPKFNNISSQVGPRDNMTLAAHVESADLVLLVSLLQQTGANIKIHNCDVTVTKLTGQLKALSHYTQEQIDVTVSFASRPEIVTTIRQRNIENLDYKKVESMIHDAISGAIASFTVPSKGGYPDFKAQLKPEQLLAAQSAVLQNTSAKPSSMRNQRLLVKVIKANSLGDKDFGCSDPYCIVQMDNPHQKHTTSVVKNTVNPFWDEHFLFDLDDLTREIKFEVFDREKPPGDDFLGRAQLPVSELRRMPSSRQIIPLTGRARAQGTQSGSLTVEFLFMEPSEAQMYAQQPLDDSLSPRRSIQTQRHQTPSGVNVTKTTMTTEKMKDSRLDASFNESPARIHKSDMLQPQGDYSPYSSRSSGYGGDTRDNITGSQGNYYKNQQTQNYLNQRKDQANRPLGSPQVMVTQASGPYDRNQYEEPINVPIIQMMDGSPSDDINENRSTSTMSQASSPVDNREKKKGGFANSLRKRFSRPKKQQRSQSADRAGTLGRGEILLNVPGEPVYQPKTTDPDTRSIKSTKSTKSLSFFSWRSKSRDRDQDADTKSIKSTKSLKFFPLRGRSKSRDRDLHSQHMTDDLDGVNIPEDGIRKSRSHSFSSSLKKLFRGKKKNKQAGEVYPSSRESSVSRASAAFAQPSPDMSSRDPSLRQPSPEPGDPRDSYPQYSTSVPVNAPIYDH